MTSAYTNNLNLELQAAGSNTDLWGDPHLNQNVFTPIDGAMGGVLSVPLTNSDVTLTNAQFCNQTFALTGTLSANVSLLFPLSPNSVGSATAVGGSRIIDNQCTGSFSVTVKTAATGSTGVVAAQGVKSIVTSDTVNVTFSDSRLGTADIMRIAACIGSPSGAVTGVAGTAQRPASMVFDATNGVLYACTADGTAGWVPQSGFFPQPQGYLTPTSGTAIITGDSTSATAVYYTPYVGNCVPIYNGSWMQAYFFSELTLALSSSQAASQIYDVFAFLNSGTVTIGTGPAWSTATPGSCSRGAGAGTTQLSRVNGLMVNTVSMSVRNGASTYTVAASQGTYLGSLYMDGTNGQVSCYRSWGQSRKWGIWNAYNRTPVFLKAGDSTASWTYATATYRASNNNSANCMNVFCGLAEEVVVINFGQRILATANTSGVPKIGIGINSTSSPSGLVGVFKAYDGGSGDTNTVYSSWRQSPFLGVNAVTALEQGAGDSTTTYYGTESNMLLTADWRA